MSQNRQQESTDQPSKGVRIAAYIEKLSGLKQRKPLREVFEREMLLEILGNNKSIINEFPLLEQQQQGIITLLSHPAIEHPIYDYISKLMGNFVNQVNHLAVASRGKDQEQIDSLTVSVVNAETLIVKCIQGVVYAVGLFTDNYEEVALHYFGKQGMDFYNELIQAQAPDQLFWKQFINRFIVDHVERSYIEGVLAKEHSLGREGQNVVLTFPFTIITSRMADSKANMDKTRIQTAYAEAAAGEGELYEFCQKMYSIQIPAIIGEAPTPLEVSNATAIICIDPAAKALYKTITEAAGEKATPDEVRIIKAQREFAQEQLLAVGVGAHLAVRILQHYILTAQDYLPPKEEAVAARLASDLRVATCNVLMQYLLEQYMLFQLRQRLKDEGNKVQLRSVRKRVVQESEIDALSSMNMNRIRKAKLFSAVAGKEGELAFKAKTPQQLAQLLTILGLEPELKKAVASLWEKANNEIDILAIIDMKLVARASTNVKVKLASILKLFQPDAV
ncbi:MAG: hypothetical protein ACNI27_03215 [Desulfovibrio sp.]